MSSSPCVVLTRELEDNLLLARALAGRGVPVRELPCVQTRYVVPDSWPSSVAAIAFGSRRAVRGFVHAGLGPRLLGGASRPLIAAVGEATRAELEACELAVDLVADPPTGLALAHALAARLEPGARVLVPRGSLAGGGLEPGLNELGRPCLPLVVYANEAPVLPSLEPFPVAAVFVAAPSAARRLLQCAPWLRTHSFLAIGPTTAAALRELGVDRILGPAMSTEQQTEILTRCWRERSPSAIPSVQR